METFRFLDERDQKDLILIVISLTHSRKCTVLENGVTRRDFEHLVEVIQL